MERIGLFRELECPVCMTVRQGRIYECPNAHIICQKCHDKLGAPRRCPACKDEMPDPPNRNVAIERIVDRLDVSVYCAFPSCGHECLKSEMAGHTAQCEFKFTRREASAGVPIPRGRTASMAAPSSALQIVDLGGMTDTEINSVIGDMNRRQIAQLLRARGTHAMFSSSNVTSSNSTPPLSSSLPSASSRTSSASSSPPNSSSFWPDAKSVALYTAPRGRTRPSVSVDGLKVETFLRVAGVRYIAQTASPKDPTMYIEIGAHRVEGAQFIIDYISRPLKFFRGRDMDIDRGLTAEQRALSRSVTALLEDRFMACHSAIQFVQHSGKFYRDIVGTYPPGKSLLGVGTAKLFKELVSNHVMVAKAKGLDRLKWSDVARRGLDDLKAVSRLLGDSPFMFGSEAARSVDCALFACMSCLLAADLADDTPFRAEVTRTEGELRNLRHHWLRMKERYWADWDDILQS